MAIEMTLQGIPFEDEYEMLVDYKDHLIGKSRVDFLVEGVIPVELKARSFTDNGDIAQSLNHLEMTNLEVSLLINFGEPSLNFKRFTNKNLKPDGKTLQGL
jgi:GxxExxY protein